MKRILLFCILITVFGCNKLKFNHIKETWIVTEIESEYEDYDVFYKFEFKRKDLISTYRGEVDGEIKEKVDNDTWEWIEKNESFMVHYVSGDHEYYIDELTANTLIFHDDNVLLHLEKE